MSEPACAKSAAARTASVASGSSVKTMPRSSAARAALASLSAECRL